MAVNNPKWSNGSIVLVQSIGNEPTVRWLVGSTIFDLNYVAAVVRFAKSFALGLNLRL